MTDRQLKNRCRVAQSLFDSPDFFPSLCSKAGNNVNEVIKLLSRIIDYILNNNVETIDIDRITESENNGFVIYPTNIYYYNMINLFGLSFMALNRGINDDLSRLDMAVSHYRTTSEVHSFAFYDDTSKAINIAQTTPSIVFSHILKQPKKNEEPISVGASEVSYYLSILEKRLRNKNEDIKTSTHKAEKTICSFVGKQALLVIIPKDIIDPTDIINREITENIPRTKIGLLRIPSRYELIQMCARNRKLEEGTKLSMEDGNVPKPKRPKVNYDLPFSYSRYEKVYVDETFDYDADDLTGDADYDIDIIYGGKDYHESRKKISPNPDENIKFIKKSSSMLITRVGDRIKINNGRHRLVYMKKFFLDHVDHCKDEKALAALREQCSVVVLVTRTFDDQEVLNIIESIIKLVPEIRIQKNSVLNDDIDLIIFIQGKILNVRNKSELIDFYNGLKEQKIKNKYEIAKLNKGSTLQSNFVIDYILKKLGKQVINLSFSDIIDYIKFKGIEKDGIKYGIDYIDLEQLYNDFITYSNITNYSILTNKEPEYFAVPKL